MAEYGVTLAGFIRKGFDVIKNENEEKARALFGDNVDLSVYSPVGLFVQMLTWKSHIIWQEMENVYYSNWLDTAEGVNLDRLVKWGGLVRENAKYALLKGVIFTGAAGYTIEKDFVIETPQGIQFKTVTSGIIDASLGGGKGIARIDCIASESGAKGMVLKDTVTEMPTKPDDVDSVTNPYEAEGGRDTETDAELRERYKIEGAEGIGSSVDAITNAILSVEGVFSAVVFENNEVSFDEEGRPPKSIECIVYSDEMHDADIAEAIFESKSAGIETFGYVQVEVEHDEKTYEIRFNRTIPVDVFLNVTIWFEGEWLDLPADDIKDNITGYLNTTESGEDIYPWRIAASNREIEGIEDIVVEIGRATAGYQEISSTPDEFFPDIVPGFPQGTYQLNVKIDTEEEVDDIDIEIDDGFTWKEIVIAINNALPFKKAIAQIVDNKIRITSRSFGEGSSVAISSGTGNDFLEAIPDDYTYSVETAVPGSISAGYHEITFTESIDPEANSNIGAGTYYLNVNIDGTDFLDKEVEIPDNAKWSDVILSLNAGLNGIGAKARIVVGNIRIINSKFGITTIVVSDGSTSGFIAATGGTLGLAVSGTFVMTSGKLSFDWREIPRCADESINIIKGS